MKLRKLLPMNLQIFANDSESGTDPGTESQAGDLTPGTGGTDPEKTFTQADVDKLIKDRLARERKEIPTKEELQAFKEWQDSQKTNEEKTNEELERLRKEAEDYKKKTQAFENKEKALKKNIPLDFVDFVVFQASQSIDESTDFDKALEDYLKANPQYAEAKPLTTGRPQKGAVEPADEVTQAFTKRTGLKLE